MKDLVVQPELRRFTVPVIHGFVSVVAASVNGKGFSFIVISRRSTYRAGEGRREEGGREGRERKEGEGKGERKGEGERKERGRRCECSVNMTLQVLGTS